MITDGWTTYDPEYQAAAIMFSQNPKVEQVMIGRIDTADTSLTTALAAIQVACVNWYAYMIIGYKQTKVVLKADFVALNSVLVTVDGVACDPVVWATTHDALMSAIKVEVESHIPGSSCIVTAALTKDPLNRTFLFLKKGKAPVIAFATTLGASQPARTITTSTTSLVFSADLIAANSIIVTVDGVACNAVVYAASHANTMALLKTEVEIRIPNSVCVLPTSDATTRTLDVTVDGDAVTVSAVVTLGATQATAIATNNITEQYKLAAAWAETQKKIFFCSTSLIDVKASTTVDIAYFLKNLAYDRTVVMYHTASEGDTTPGWMEAGWMGECLPYDAGSQTWAYKTLAGVSPYLLTSGERTNITGKNCNIYTTTGGVNITETGKVASGEWIDIIRGIDWISARLEENVFAGLIAVRKIPYTDEGVSVMSGIVKGVLKEAAAAGILITDTIVVTAPLVADVSSADKIARLLPDLTFKANLQGAIHLVEITGTVTV
jgi:hypothetical protein